ncbi:NUDIX hydrolase [Spirillospora albida]|uniref:NUDIX hydrolase n=1 Tax=Spirillospora albida TaxID=58123 RepID=UPI000A0464BE|nr:NUDIX domain-containing protein [Spirillospora albida]
MHPTPQPGFVKPTNEPGRHRVRAVLLTPEGNLLLMKRIRPGVEPYWVVIGGGVEDTDAGPLDALHREIREEIAGSADIVRHLHTLESPGGGREDFYLAAITNWNFTARTGPEFTRTDRGEYRLEQIPATPQAVAAINLKPNPIADVLRAELDAGTLTADGHARHQAPR